MCQATTKSGAPCRNQATLNGYCHLHGGLLSRKGARRQMEREYAAMTPEQRTQADRTGYGVVIVT